MILPDGIFRAVLRAAPALAICGALALPASAQVTPFMQAVAEAAAEDRPIAEFYRNTEYQPLWTGDTPEHMARRTALLSAIERAGDHNLPAARYMDMLRGAKLRGITTERELGEAEVAMSRLFVTYAKHVSSGVLVPKQVTSEIAREVSPRLGTELLTEFASAEPVGYLRSLVPQTPEYGRLMKVKIELEALMADGGWGPRVPAGSLRPGNTGQAVVALRNRLIKMGYLERSVTSTYDLEMQKAVQAFQINNGIEPDGVAGGRTMTEINRQIEERLPSVMVAMERERWLGVNRGDRHVLVNLTDFTAAIIDDGEERFRTRSVVGANDSERRTVEFSDTMEYMEINPYWNVPRSISVPQYISAMIASGGAAAGHLELVDGRGNVVSRAAVNWGAHAPRNFPYDVRQPPGPGNALGRVKYMFPNRYNIYLHDTPAKSLFSHNVRMYSHGCVRLNDPFEFGYALLERQVDNPREHFDRILNSWQNTKVYLDTPIPVHIIYRTAYTTPKGGIQFRADHYGRDAKVFRALQQAGVVMPGARS